MALESVDLLTLLKRVRKPIAEVAVASEVEPKPEPAPEPAVESQSPLPYTGPVAMLGESASELAELRMELFNDEVLIQRMLGLLYRSKKKNPNSGFISILDMEKILSIEREGAAFVMMYMKTQKVIEMDDKSRMAITVPGIIYLRSVLGIQGAPTVATVADPES